MGRDSRDRDTLLSPPAAAPVAPGLLPTLGTLLGDSRDSLGSAALYGHLLLLKHRARMVRGQGWGWNGAGNQLGMGLGLSGKGFGIIWKRIWDCGKRVWVRVRELDCLGKGLGPAGWDLG